MNISETLSLICDFRRISLVRTLVAGRPLSVLVGHRTYLTGSRRVRVARGGRLRVGVEGRQLAGRKATTDVAVRGSMEVDGWARIGKGCRIDIGERGTLRIGEGSFLSPNVVVIAHAAVTIGPDCAIGWGTQLIDTDFHTLERPGSGSKDGQAPISLGSRVWVGSNVTILKGVTLAEGTIVAAGSTVVKSQLEPNCLVGGNPARQLRANLRWH